MRGKKVVILAFLLGLSNREKECELCLISQSSTLLTPALLQFPFSVPSLNTNDLCDRNHYSISWVSLRPLS